MKLDLARAIRDERERLARRHSPPLQPKSTAMSEIPEGIPADVWNTAMMLSPAGSGRLMQMAFAEVAGRAILGERERCALIIEMWPRVIPDEADLARVIRNPLPTENSK